MKTDVTKYDFHDAFRAYGRTDQFSPDGLDLLYDWLISFEGDTGEETELDVIALCCDFYEDSWEAIADNYSIDLSDCDNDEEKLQTVSDYLAENTTLVGDSGSGLIYHAF